jgi:hypothetical protein
LATIRLIVCGVSIANRHHQELGQRDLEVLERAFRRQPNRSTGLAQEIPNIARLPTLPLSGFRYSARWVVVVHIHVRLEYQYSNIRVLIFYHLARTQ